MDTPQELINWLIGLMATSAVALVIGVINILRAGKLLPREVKDADLSNKLKEISIAEQYDKLATQAADKIFKTQERLNALEEQSEALKEKLDEQGEIISRQADIIEQQSEQIRIQSERLSAQQIEIATLVCELDNYKTYTNALIAQMREANMIPVAMESVELEDCKEINTPDASSPDHKAKRSRRKNQS